MLRDDVAIIVGPDALSFLAAGFQFRMDGCHIIRVDRQMTKKARRSFIETCIANPPAREVNAGDFRRAIESLETRVTSREN